MTIATRSNEPVPGNLWTQRPKDAKGCPESPGPLGCLECKLAACRYDDKVAYFDVIRRRRWDLMRARYEQVVAERGLVGTARIVAREFGVSVRTLHRAAVAG